MLLSAVHKASVCSSGPFEKKIELQNYCLKFEERNIEWNKNKMMNHG